MNEEQNIEERVREDEAGAELAPESLDHVVGGATPHPTPPKPPFEIKDFSF